MALGLVRAVLQQAQSDDAFGGSDERIFTERNGCLARAKRHLATEGCGSAAADSGMMLSCRFLYGRDVEF